RILFIQKKITCEFLLSAVSFGQLNALCFIFLKIWVSILFIMLLCYYLIVIFLLCFLYVIVMLLLFLFIFLYTILLLIHCLHNGAHVKYIRHVIVEWGRLNES
ncbi:hypothetical protein L9F63_009408, partial [Diploptera punctata]